MSHLETKQNRNDICSPKN